MLTKQQLNRAFRYRFSNTRDIAEAYYLVAPSKQKRFEEIKQEMLSLGGFDLRITGASTRGFTCAYQLDTIEGRVLVWHGVNGTEVIKPYEE